MIPARADLRARLPNSLPDYLRRCVTIDSRSLAAFRIAIALLIIADVLLRSRNFHFYYTDDGVVPQDLAQRAVGSDAVSVFFWTQDPTLIAGLFALHALIAVVLLVGYKTRVAMFLSFLFIISLDHHNPFVTSFADTLFRMITFWALFLPLGERWSIDAIHRNRAPRKSVANLATAAIMVQMVFMYFTNGIAKSPSTLWQTGRAAILVMGIDEMTFLLGDFMRNFPLFLQVGGFTWFAILLLSPLLILLYGRARYPLIVLFVGGHASFALTVRIGAFAYVALAGLITFLQPRFWADAWAVLTRIGIDRRLGRLRDTAGDAGYTVAGVLPGKLIDFPGRDQMVHGVLSVVLIFAIFTLFVFPPFGFAAQAGVLEEDPTPRTVADEIAENWRVDQPVWSVFAGPDPRSIDRYYVFPARTADGELIDIYNERPMTWDRPGQELQRQHDTYRMRFYMNSIRRSSPQGPLPQLLAEHLCETWEEEHGVELTHINMWEVTERITFDTVDDPEDREVRRSLITEQTCDARYQPGPIAPPDEFEADDDAGDADMLRPADEDDE